jgi:hypothetical protein
MLPHSQRLKTNAIKNFIKYPFKNKTKKVEFRFDTGEHSLRVSAKSVEKSGQGP